MHARAGSSASASSSIAARVEPELHHGRDEGHDDQAADDGRVNTLLVLDLGRGLEGAFGLGLVPGGVRRGGVRMEEGCVGGARGSWGAHR